MSPQVEAVTSRLRRTRIRWWTFSLWTALVISAGISLGILAFFVMADAIFKLPQGVLVASFVAWAGMSLAAFSILIARLQRGKRTLAATARRVELAFPELESQLINIVQFARLGRSVPTGRPRPGRRGGRRFPVRPGRDPGKPVAAVLALHADAARPARLVPGPRRDPGARAAHERDRSDLGLVDATAPPPVHVRPLGGLGQDRPGQSGRCEVLIGSSLQISARIENPAARPLYRPPCSSARLTSPNRRWRCFPARTTGRIVAALPQVLTPLEYRLQIGDSQTRLYRVSVYEKPTIAEVEVTYDFPAYLERPRATVKQNHADLEAPQFTRGGAEDPSLDPDRSRPSARGGGDHRRPGDRGRPDAGRAVTAQGNDDVHDPPLHGRGAYRPPAPPRPDQGAGRRSSRGAAGRAGPGDSRCRGEQAADRGPGRRRLRSRPGPDRDSIEC